jgi:hypothetical protein
MPAASTEYRGGPQSRRKLDLRGFNYVEYRYRTTGTVPVSGASFAIQWGTDDTNFRNTDIGSGTSADPDSGARITSATFVALTTYTSGKVAMHADMKAAGVFTRILTKGGDGTTDPGVQYMEAIFTVD